MLPVLLVTCLFIAVVIWITELKRPTKFPPGPFGFPILGHLPLLGTTPHLAALKWRQKYGPVVGIWFGSYRTVVLHDIKLIKEALSMGVFAGRPKISLFTAMCGGSLKGLVFNEGPFLHDQRRFAIKNLKDFGFGSKTLEAKIQDEVIELLQTFKAADGKPVKINHIFNAAVVNTLWSIMFSERLKQDDPEVEKAVKRVSSLAQDIGILTNLAIFIPWISKIAPNLTGFTDLLRTMDDTNSFIEKSINRHKETYVQNQPRDFVDLYMDEVNRVAHDPNSSFHPINQQMVHSIYDLFGAGTETTSTTLQWICAYAIHYPEVQKKLQRKIDHLIGKDRIPSLTDEPALNYTEAFINEVMRISSLTFCAIYHNTMEDVEFHGYLIPKNTMVIPNMYSCHFDPQVWGDPKNFRPERFLDERGIYTKNENLMAFSSGKRACIGKAFARDELFLFTTCLFQKFTLRAAGTLPNLTPKVAVVMAPHPFEVVFEERFAI